MSDLALLRCPTLLSFPMKRFSLLALLIALVGCEDSVVGPQVGSSQGVVASAHGGDAVYRAVLRPLNASENGGGVTGKVDIVVEGGDVPVIDIDLNARGLAPGITHIQHIHAGESCPTSADDANGDQVLDLVEGIPVYGGILVSLDDDLASANGVFPMADSRGRVSYSSSVGAGALIGFLRDSGALESDENLNLAGRHIVVHGVAADTDLPDTVQSIGDIPAQVTLPVACGEIVLR